MISWYDLRIVYSGLFVTVYYVSGFLYGEFLPSFALLSCAIVLDVLKRSLEPKLDIITGSAEIWNLLE